MLYLWNLNVIYKQVREEKTLKLCDIHVAVVIIRKNIGITTQQIFRLD